MNCERNTTHAMSDLCLEAWSYGYNSTENCIPSYMKGATGILAGIWHVFNASIGFIGNLLTLIAIPYAARNKKLVHFLLLNSVFIFQL